MRRKKTASQFANGPSQRRTPSSAADEGVEDARVLSISAHVSYAVAIAENATPSASTPTRAASAVRATRVAGPTIDDDGTQQAAPQRSNVPAFSPSHLAGAADSRAPPPTLRGRSLYAEAGTRVHTRDCGARP